MPNVTVTIPAESYRNARVWAAANNTTVTRVVRDILNAIPKFSAAKLKSLRPSEPDRAASAKLMMPGRKGPAPQNRDVK